MGYCQRFMAEFKRPMFDLDEPPYGRLDLKESFHMGEGLLSWVGLIKSVVLGLVVAGFVHAFIQFPFSHWYPAYLTPWGVFFCIWYLIGSLLVTTCGVPKAESSSPTVEETPTRLVKFTWMVFSLACVWELVVIVMYWAFDYDPEKDSISLNNLNVHGITGCVTILHGILVDRVPVRIKHFVLTVSIGAIFCGWLAIQNLVVEYNPLYDDDDDALYDVLKWKANPTQAAILSAIVLLVAFPFFTVFMWMLSLPGRLYLQILEAGSEGGLDIEAPKEDDENNMEAPKQNVVSKEQQSSDEVEETTHQA